MVLDDFTFSCDFSDDFGVEIDSFWAKSLIFLKNESSFKLKIHEKYSKFLFSVKTKIYLYWKVYEYYWIFTVYSKNVSCSRENSQKVFNIRFSLQKEHHRMDGFLRSFNVDHIWISEIPWFVAVFDRLVLEGYWTDFNNFWCFRKLRSWTF